MKTAAIIAGAISTTLTIGTALALAASPLVGALTDWIH